MSWSESFAAECDQSVQVLVLGSMPGLVSLVATEYYAHPRNSFWPIMEKLFAIDCSEPYQQRIQSLMEKRVGLWDVYQSCYRPGSLDSDIDKKTAEINDFKALFKICKNLNAIVLNGKAAESAFKKHVLKGVPEHIKILAMPSTSPAYAAMSFDEKFKYWSKIKSYA